MGQTVGTDFDQPQRLIPQLSFTDSYIKINNAAGLNMIKESLMRRMEIQVE